MPGNLAQRLMWIVWPAFLVACLADAVFFMLFDPIDLHVFDNALDISREAFYTFGFFGFWGLAIASSALTVFLGHSSFEVGRCPVDAPTRPKTEDLDGRSDHDSGPHA